MFRSTFSVSVVSLSLLMATSALARPISFVSAERPTSGSLAIAVAEGAENTGIVAEIDAAWPGDLARLVKDAEFTGKDGSKLLLRGVAGYDRLLLVGTGKDGRLSDLGGNIATELAGDVTVMLATPDAVSAAETGFGATLGSYRFDRYKSAPKVADTSTLRIATSDPAAAKAWYDRDRKPVADAVIAARDLITEPANAIYPESFVERMAKAFAGLPNVKITVLGVPEMEKLGMGGLLSVGVGSARPSRLMVVEYTGGSSGTAPVAFVGKGITFDSGGISIKPSANMWEMKTDMAGAAASVGTVLALAKRGAKVNAVGVAALAENMPSGSATRPGDVVKTMSGKTIEIWNTDAEGRMVLSDAIWYTQEKYKPSVVIDLATLTGSIVTALGDKYAGLFSRQDTLAAQLTEAGRKSGENVWRMPFHPSYADAIKSDIADINNSPGKGPGAAIGAEIIGAFVKDGQPWAHIDIAGTAWEDNKSPTVPKGAVGFGIRLLDQWVRDTQEAK